MTVRHHAHLVDGKKAIIGYETRIKTCILTHFPRDFEGAFEIPAKVHLDGEDWIVAGIADNAFRGCKKLIKLEIPDTVMFIGQHAFADCSSLTDVTIPSGTEIHKYAFS